MPGDTHASKTTVSLSSVYSSGGQGSSALPAISADAGRMPVQRLNQFLLTLFLILAIALSPLAAWACWQVGRTMAALRYTYTSAE